MTEKRMLIVDADVARRIDENRGELSQSEFLSFILDSFLRKETSSPNLDNFVQREEFDQFSRGIKELLRNFLEFFLSYGLELGEKPDDKAIAELTKKLKSLSQSEK